MNVEMDSDLDDVLDFEIDGTAIAPYSFEPLRAERNETRDESSDEQTDSDSDIQNNGMDRPVAEWCSCSNCMDMPTALESKCCKSTNVVDGKAEGLECIMDHEGFAVNCLNRHVLETSYYEFVIQNGPPGEDELIHEVYRYIAYRRFTRWIYGLLGKRNRRVIPSCVVKAIREAFPSEEYAGFQYPQ